MADHESPLTFTEFDPPDYDTWYEETVRTLKGKPFEKLVKTTYEGFDIQPIYRRQDSKDVQHQYTLPGDTPFVRGTQLLGNLAQPWRIAQEIPYGTPRRFNDALKNDIDRGQTAVYMVIDAATSDNLDPDQASVYDVGMGGVSLATRDDVLTALDGVSLNNLPLYVEAGEAAYPLAMLIAGALKSRGDVDLTGLRGAIDADPLGTLAQSGGLSLSLENAYDDMAQVTRWAIENAPHLATIRVNVSVYNSAGANAVQELAFAMATGAAYLRAMTERDLGVNDVAKRMRFVFAVGANFFMEIAKLRAAKLLWGQIVEAFGGDSEAQKMRLHVRTSTYNKTVYDPYVNMLRVTTEGLAAAVAGIESMHIAPFDEAITEPDEFSRRIARNVQVILREEANIPRVIDPAGGSYYVEYLTDQLAKHAWALFQQIEVDGGMAEALMNGVPQAQIAEVAAKRQANLATRKDTLIGTNVHPNLTEKLPDRDVDYEAIYNERAETVQSKREDIVIQSNDADRLLDAVAEGATLNQIFTALYGDADDGGSVEPLDIHRVAAGFEDLRRASELYADENGHPPRIFLANMGPLKQHKTRADFTVGFFGVGGFEIVNPVGFDSPQDAANAALDSGAGVTVICSTDDTYPELVPPFVKAVKAGNPDMIVMLAGYPPDQIDAHKAAGVDDFIHLPANCYEMNAKLQEEMGVR